MKTRKKKPYYKCGTKEACGKGCFGGNKATKSWKETKNKKIKNVKSSMSRALKSGNKVLYNKRAAQLTMYTRHDRGRH